MLPTHIHIYALPACAGEAAEQRLLEISNPEVCLEPRPEELISAHAYYVGPLLPPEAFMAAGPGGELPVPEHALLFSGLGSVLRTVGRVLGGHDAATALRWQHLAGGEQLREVCACLVHQWLKPYQKGKDWEFAMTRLCLPGGCG